MNLKVLKAQKVQYLNTVDQAQVGWKLISFALWMSVGLSTSAAKRMIHKRYGFYLNCRNSFIFERHNSGKPHIEPRITIFESDLRLPSFAGTVCTWVAVAWWNREEMLSLKTQNLGQMTCKWVRVQDACKQVDKTVKKSTLALYPWADITRCP